MTYLDNAATTACAPEVVDAMLPFFTQHYANASSIDHPSGAFARRAVEDSRNSIATLLDSRPEDVIFTSGATEANNLVISMDHSMLSTTIEHPSILEPFLKRNRPGDALMPTTTNGLIDLTSLRDRLSAQQGTTLVSIIATNNEVGCEQDVVSIGQLMNEFNSILHLDATQAISSREISFKKSMISALSISAHKIHGPKGVGALVAGPEARRLIKPISRGGGQERNLRSGTLNVPGIVGFGVAAQLLIGKVTSYRNHLRMLRKGFLDTLNSKLGNQVIETISNDAASPHILSLRFPGINARALLGVVSPQLAFSLGAACATNKSEPSHVLIALGLTKSEIAQTMRFSFSRYQELPEIRQAALVLADAVSNLRQFALPSKT